MPSNHDQTITFTTNDDHVTQHGTDIDAEIHDTTLRVVGLAINDQVPQLVSDMIAKHDAERQKKEDERSIKRNRNRMYTLVVALFISIFVTYTLQSTFVAKTHWGHVMGPYTFAITVTLDAGMVLWAYIHRY